MNQNIMLVFKNEEEYTEDIYNLGLGKIKNRLQIHQEKK